MLQKPTPIEAYKILNQKMNSTEETLAIPMDLSLVYRESLAQYPQYLFLKDKLIAYSQKAIKNPKIDTYEIKTYQKLFHLLYDLSRVDDKQLQIAQIKQTETWLEQQDKIIKNRVKQGMQRFKITKESRKAMSQVHKSTQKKNHSPMRTPLIPSDIIQQAMMPYAKKWRTAHQGEDLPSKRLHYYDTKKIVIEQIPKNKIDPESAQKYKILNNKVSYALNSHTPNSSTYYKDQDGRQVQTQIQQQQPSIANYDDLPEEIILPDDIPMFGEQPQQPQESKDGQGDGDLVPKVKLYLSQTKIPSKVQQQKTSLIYMKQKQSIQEKRLQLMFKNKRQKQIIQKNQDNEMIKMAQKMARDKSTNTKQEQKKLQLRAVNHSYCFLKQQPQQQFKFSEDLQLKYRLSDIKSSRKQSAIDLGFHLPKINSARSSLSIQKSVEKPSLDILKKRFSHILNLSPEQEDQPISESVPKSIAQFSSRTRAFSDLLEKYTKKSHRQQQIQQLQSVRQRLNAKKLGVNLKALVGGLCPPEDNPLNIQLLPQKNLLHNQFMADVKKGKKKKK